MSRSCFVRRMWGKPGGERLVFPGDGHIGVSSGWRASAVNCESVSEQRCKARKSKDTPIRSSVLFTRHPHPPTPYVLRAWWTSSTGTEEASGCPPVGGRRRLEGSVPRGRGFGFARVTSISPRTTVNPLILHPAALQWSERASIQQTNKSKDGQSLGVDVMLLIEE